MSLRPPNVDLRREKIIEDEILAHRAHIKELTKSLDLTKARSRPEWPHTTQVIDLDDVPHGRSRTPAPRDDC